MAVIKEWRCICGNFFESAIDICPKCGATEEPYVTRFFSQPPAFKSDRTKFKDSSLKDFTSQYGLSDFTNNVSQKHDKDFSHLWKPVSDLTTDPSLAGGSDKAMIDVAMKSAAESVNKASIVGASK